jgi:hypothetical protein
VIRNARGAIAGRSSTYPAELTRVKFEPSRGRVDHDVKQFMED